MKRGRYRGISTVVGATIFVLIMLVFFSTFLLLFGFIEEARAGLAKSVASSAEVRAIANSFTGGWDVDEDTGDLFINLTSNAGLTVELVGITIVFNDSSYIMVDESNGTVTDATYKVKSPSTVTSGNLALPIKIGAGYIVEITFKSASAGKLPIWVSITIQTPEGIVSQIYLARSKALAELIAENLPPTVPLKPQVFKLRYAGGPNTETWMGQATLSSGVVEDVLVVLRAPGEDEEGPGSLDFYNVTVVEPYLSFEYMFSKPTPQNALVNQRTDVASNSTHLFVVAPTGVGGRLELWIGGFNSADDWALVDLGGTSLPSNARSVTMEYVVSNGLATEFIAIYVEVPAGIRFFLVNLSDTTNVITGSLGDYELGRFAVSAVFQDVVYLSTDFENQSILLSHNITSNTVIEHTLLTGIKNLGMIYVNGRLWIMEERGPLYSLNATTGNIVLDRFALPFSPRGEGDRLEYFAGRIIFVRADDTIEVWVFPED